jgi:peptidoglycan-associated lipoprotein
MNRLISTLAVAVLLAACGSSVKLDNTPVEDRSSTGSANVMGDTGAGTQSGTGSAVGSNNVKSVDLSQADKDLAMRLATRTVYFDYDSFAIRSEFQAVIEAHARFIRADKNKKVVLEGHTDERGGREYNLALGQKRAEAVRRALVLQGVSESQVEAVSFGKEKPAVVGNSDAAMEKNRRAEISYR